MAKSHSCRLSVSLRRRGQTSQRANQPSVKRINKISRGVKSRSSTLVEIKVTPQTIMVIRAARCPINCFRSVMMFLPAHRLAGMKMRWYCLGVKPIKHLKNFVK